MVKVFIICFICLISLPLSSQELTIITREEASVYALRLADALNISIKWLHTSDLPTGEEIADVEDDKIDFYALQGLDYNDIVSINSTKSMYFSGWLKDVNYIFPSGYGNILVNAYSREVLAIGDFPTNITGAFNEEKALNITYSIINSFYGNTDYEWRIRIEKIDDDEISTYFSSFKFNLKCGRPYGSIWFSPKGSIYKIHLYHLDDNPVINITIDQAKQAIVDAINEISIGKREAYYITASGSKFKLPKIYFVCFGKHPDVIIPENELNDLLKLWNFKFGEGIYFIDEDDFLQARYAYVIPTTIEIEDVGKVFTYYSVDTITGEVEGFGLTNIYFRYFGFSNLSDFNKINDIKCKTKIMCCILNDREIILQYVILKGNRVYISQDCLPVFKAQMRNNKLLGRNGEIQLTKDELQWLGNKVYVPLRRICEVSGIRLWWDNERKVPILRAEWLEPRKLLAQRR